MWEKIVLNLLSNAFKFTFTGSISVRLGLRDDGAYLEVADTGSGIAEHELPRVFERFHRIAGARSRSHEGSGIGLALIHELVHLHGGSISVASKEGVGTTFTVRIPRGATHLPTSRLGATRSLPATRDDTKTFVEEAARWSGTDFSASPSTSTPEERIVFADDNADMRDYVTRLLGERWQVEAVGDGQVALDAVRRAPPALVLSDVMMPSLDGFQLIAAMRADEALRAIPIILLSARRRGRRVSQRPQHRG